MLKSNFNYSEYEDDLKSSHPAFSGLTSRGGFEDYEDYEDYCNTNEFYSDKNEDEDEEFFSCEEEDSEEHYYKDINEKKSDEELREEIEREREMERLREDIEQGNIDFLNSLPKRPKGVRADRFVKKPVPPTAEEIEEAWNDFQRIIKKEKMENMKLNEKIRKQKEKENKQFKNVCLKYLKSKNIVLSEKDDDDDDWFKIYCFEKEKEKNILKLQNEKKSN